MVIYEDIARGSEIAKIFTDCREFLDCFTSRQPDDTFWQTAQSDLSARKAKYSRVFGKEMLNACMLALKDCVAHAGRTDYQEALKAGYRLLKKYLNVEKTNEYWDSMFEETAPKPGDSKFLQAVRLVVEKELHSKSLAEKALGDDLVPATFSSPE